MCRTILGIYRHFNFSSISGTFNQAKCYPTTQHRALPLCLLCKSFFTKWNNKFPSLWGHPTSGTIWHGTPFSPFSVTWVTIPAVSTFSPMRETLSGPGTIACLSVQCHNLRKTPGSDGAALAVSIYSSRVATERKCPMLLELVFMHAAQGFQNSTFWKCLADQDWLCASLFHGEFSCDFFFVKTEFKRAKRLTF